MPSENLQIWLRRTSERGALEAAAAPAEDSALAVAAAPTKDSVLTSAAAPAEDSALAAAAAPTEDSALTSAPVPAEDSALAAASKPAAAELTPLAISFSPSFLINILAHDRFIHGMFALLATGILLAILTVGLPIIPLAAGLGVAGVSLVGLSISTFFKDKRTLPQAVERDLNLCIR